MNTLLILRQIPPKLRLVLLLAYLAAVVVLFVLHAFSVDLPYDELNKGLLAAGAYLTLQSATNVHPVNDSEE